MKRLVQRQDIVDYATYDDTRAQTRPTVMAAKKLRRVHLNESLTFLFENRDTLRYQIQEIMRAERIVREASIVNEIETYNSILGDSGDVGCVLLIEIEREEDRKPLLTEWLGLQQHLYVRLADGDQVYARFDPSQVGADRLSAVQYLQFPVDGQVPVAIGTDFDGLESEVDLTPEQVAALTEDLNRK
jgi:hypothetical protein